MPRVAFGDAAVSDVVPKKFAPPLDKKQKDERTALLGLHPESAAGAGTLANSAARRLYQQLYGLKNVRDVWDPPTRGASGKFMVMPFFDR